MPKVSIITINLNNEEGLRRTLDSVQSQAYTNYEHIIIDGGSGDGSMALMELNQSKISYQVSEKDTGVYNAMNKGIKKATGDYLFFLNSGDIFYSDKTLELLFEKEQAGDIIYGNIKNVNGEKEWIVKPPASLSFDFLLKNNLPHQSSFIKASLFEKFGLYNEDNRIVSDWEFILTCLGDAATTYHYVDQVIAVYNFDGISSRPENFPLIKEERDRLLKKRYALFLDDYPEFKEMERQFLKYKTSRLHQLIEKVIQSGLYRRLKK